MQTFITATTLCQCAANLDPVRRFKQAVECKQIYLALTGKSTAYRNHPATQQWAGYESELIALGNICLYFHRLDGGKAPKLSVWYAGYIRIPAIGPIPRHLQPLIPYHKGLLVYKDFTFYNKVFPGVRPVYYPRYVDPGSRQIFHCRRGQRIYETAGTPSA